jgi:hypothetical protein
MNREQLIHETGKTLVEDIGSRKPSWAQLVLVATIEDDSTETSGFVYFEDGKYEPVSPRGFATSDLLEQLRKAMAKADRKAPWRACLIKIDRASGEVDIQFEYDQADRWAVNLKNSAKRAEEFRPLRPAK